MLLCGSRLRDRTRGGTRSRPMRKKVKSARCTGSVPLGGRRTRRAGWLCAFAGLAALFIAAGAGLLSSHAQSSPAQDGSASQPLATSTANPESALPQNANSARVEPQAPGAYAAQPAGNAPVDASKREIEAESANLLKMATALKAEVDKTTKDTLSVTVVRKAGEIEQLAHKVRLGTGKG